jgi:SAM-dependent methyltransferase
MSDWQTLTMAELAPLWGTTPDHISTDLHNAIQQAELRYQKLPETERDQIILYVLRQLDENKFAKAGQARRGIWEQAWAERAQNFSASQHTLDSLSPQYFNANLIVRLNGDYVRPAQASCETQFSNLFRQWLFQTYLGEARAIYEFGCGSGFNLTQLARLYPEKNLYGLDWTSSAVQLVNTIAQSHQLRLQGSQFDFFAPDDGLAFEPHSAVLTMCALEQVGERHEEFLNFLLRKSPLLCVHMEPICDFYDTNQLVDYLAWRYHTQRNYLSGFVQRLQQLANDHKIAIVASQRVPFGNLYHEGYSYIVWRPI